jgi:hypothetical protein
MVFVQNFIAYIWPKPTQGKIWNKFASASFIERTLLCKLCYLLWSSILKQRYQICCIINRRFRKTDFLTECYFIYRSALRKMSITFYWFRELNALQIDDLKLVRKTTYTNNEWWENMQFPRGDVIFRRFLVLTYS